VSTINVVFPVKEVVALVYNCLRMTSGSFLFLFLFESTHYALCIALF